MKCQTSCYYGGFERHREGVSGEGEEGEVGGDRRGRGLEERSRVGNGVREGENKGDTRSKR